MNNRKPLWSRWQVQSNHRDPLAAQHVRQVHSKAAAINSRYLNPTTSEKYSLRSSEDDSGDVGAKIHVRLRAVAENAVLKMIPAKVDRHENKRARDRPSAPPLHPTPRKLPSGTQRLISNATASATYTGHNCFGRKELHGQIAQQHHRQDGGEHHGVDHPGRSEQQRHLHHATRLQQHETRA